MGHSQFIPDPVDIIDHLVCPKCQTQMWLTVIAPDEKSDDLRTFQCQECEYEESIVVRYR